MGRLLRELRDPVRARDPDVLRRPVRGGVLRRLHHRVQPLGRQPVRLRDHHDDVRGAGDLPAQGAAVRDSRRARAARSVHRGRGGGDRAVRVGFLPLRGVPALHGVAAGVPAGGRRGGGVPGERGAAADPPVPSGDRPLSRRRGVHPDRRQAVRDADARRDAGDRDHRHPVRARLHPGDLRADQGAVPGLHVERVRADGVAAALLPARRAAEPAGLPGYRAGGDPRVHRSEADPGGAARRGGHLGAGDRHHRLARGHRRRPRRHHRTQPSEGPPRSLRRPPGVRTAPAPGTRHSRSPPRRTRRPSPPPRRPATEAPPAPGETVRPPGRTDPRRPPDAAARDLAAGGPRHRRPGGRAVLASAATFPRARSGGTVRPACRPLFRRHLSAGPLPSETVRLARAFGVRWGACGPGGGRRG